MASRFLTESQTVWSTPVAGTGADSTPALALGRLFYASNDSGVGTLHAIDIQSADVSWSWQAQSEQAQMTHRPVVGSGMIFVGTSQGLRAHDMATGKPVWTYSGKGSKKTAVVCEPALGQNLVLFAQADQHYRALTTDGDLKWEFQVLGSQCSAATFWGTTALFASSSTSSPIYMVYAVDAASGKQLWNMNTGSPILTTPAVGTVPSTGQTLVFVGCADGTVRALDFGTGTEAWRFTTQAAVNSTPGYYNGVVYFGSNDANLYAVDAATGTQQWKMPATSGISTGIFIQDGVAYFGTLNTGGNQPALVAVDLQSQGADYLQFAAQNAVAFTATMENGVVYFFDGTPSSGGSIVAVNMEDVLHEFFVESVLMVSTYDTSGTAPLPQNPAYRTAIKLFDDQKNARPLQPVKVWATGPVSITVGGTAYTLGTETPAWVQADAGGELVIEAASPQLPMPALCLWANFMAPEETVVVYPDHLTVQTLSTVQGSDLDPNNPTRPAVGYDGQPVLQSQYASDENARNNIASAIQNSLGATTATTQAMFRGVAADAATTYLAFPQSMPSTVYVPSGGAQGRPLSQGQTLAAWTLDFSSGVSFSPTASSLALALDAKPLSFLTKIEDFIKNVVNGVEKVAKTVWQWVEGAVQVLIQTAENVYQLVINTLEDALNVVVGFLKTVVNDIKKAFEWLSWVFDFKDMVSNAGLIADKMMSSLSGLQTWLSGTATADIKQFFSGLESTAQGAFQKMIDNVGGSSYQSAQQNQTDPQATYGKDGAQSYSQSRWMLEKVQQNAGATSAAAFSALPLGDNGNPLADAITGFLGNVQQTLSSDSRFTDLVPQIKGGFTAMSQLATSSGQASQAALKELLAGIEAVVELLIEAAEVITEALVKLLSDVISGLQTLLTSPLPIPFINAIYKLITGNDLRVIDLAAFLVSVPATIVSKIVDGQGSSSTSARAMTPAPPSTLFFYTALFSGLCYALFDAGSDLSEQPSTGMDTIAVALNLIFWAINYPTGETLMQQWVYWGLGLVPMAISAASIKGGLAEEMAPWLLSGTGVGLMVGAIVFAAEWDSFLGTDGLVLIQNLVGNIPLVVKPLKLVGPEALPVIAVVDLIGDGAEAILDIVNFDLNNSSSQAAGKLVSA